MQLNATTGGGGWNIYCSPAESKVASSLDVSSFPSKCSLINFFSFYSQKPFCTPNSVQGKSEPRR